MYFLAIPCIFPMGHWPSVRSIVAFQTVFLIVRILFFVIFTFFRPHQNHNQNVTKTELVFAAKQIFIICCFFLTLLWYIFFISTKNTHPLPIQFVAFFFLLFVLSHSFSKTYFKLENEKISRVSFIHFSKMEKRRK